ncbi:LuxR family transcriptional regulator (plasmid) [Bradyrhizobium sp. 62B]|uniref:helix-turn-helix transcriptional regulator n=1 Tax=Bradyrhizobium sp. 62B TaxID=2898442 RepID=UPI0025580F4A|nr:LuxR family transcriptional regulator [Bradyrhizobium sp. 62B]
MNYDLINCAANTQSLSPLFQMLVSKAGKLGFGSVAYAAVTYAPPKRLRESPAPMIASNFPSHWSKPYAEHEYGNIDPAIHRSRRFSRPICWEELSARCRLLPEEQRALDFYKIAGFKRGVSVPLFAAQGHVSVALFASESDRADPKGSLLHLAALASQFHIGYGLIAPLPDENRYLNVTFTPREKEILLHAAEGRSSWHIGRLLHISGNSVDFHMKNIMRKMGTSTRTVAIREAYRAGLIHYASPTNEECRFSKGHTVKSKNRTLARQ